MSIPTLTRTEAAALEQVLRNSFTIKSLADLGVQVRLGKLDATMEEVFDLASVAAGRNGLNLAEKPSRRRVAIEMFHCIRMTDLSDREVSAVIESGLLKTLRK